MRTLFCTAILSVIIFLANISISWAAEKKYPVSEIPDELRNGKAVVRKEFQELKLVSEKKAVLKHYTAITILNESGKNLAQVDILYGPFNKVIVKSASIYDARGNKVKKISGSKFLNRAVFTGNFLDDIRALSRYLDYNYFPYTIEYEYTMQYSSLLNLPGWYPVSEPGIAVMESSFKVISNDKISFRYFERNSKASKHTDKKNEVFVWTVKNMAARKNHRYPLPEKDLPPHVQIAPTKFEVAGIKSDASDWKSFGQFFYFLNDEQNDLDAVAKAEIRALIKDTPDKKEAARILYNHLQKSCRYVSIQLGIGGWQSYKASFVHKNKFGDCKALTYYMRSMLKEAGIISYPVLIRAGEEAPDILTEFPSNQFNHVILAIPFENDTTWLECTSTYNPFGYLGSFTQNRHALWITPNGGELVRTPVTTITDNKAYSYINVKIDEKAEALVNLKAKYTGTFQENLRHYQAEAASKDMQKFFYSQFTIPTFTLNQYSVKEADKLKPEMHCLLTLSVPAVGQTAKNRIFLNPHQLLNKLDIAPFRDSYSEAFSRNSFEIVDTLEIEIMKGFSVSSLPKAVQLSSDFATYQNHLSVTEEGTLLFIRKYIQKAALPTSKQLLPDLEFYKAILQSEKQVVVFSKE